MLQEAGAPLGSGKVFALEATADLRKDWKEWDLMKKLKETQKKMLEMVLRKKRKVERDVGLGIEEYENFPM